MFLITKHIPYSTHSLEKLMDFDPEKALREKKRRIVSFLNEKRVPYILY